MTLEVRDYTRFSEKLYSECLKNGLKVYYLPKTDFQESYAILSSRFGSVDTLLTDGGNEPSGIAHFLEHKLFEDASGKDVLLDFTKLGADANAFTTYDRTSYLVSTTVNFMESLSLLLDFVSQPYFKEESVNREIGIIEQEIEMYADDADYRLFLGLLQTLYPGTALAEDIAGSVEDIKNVTPEILQSYYDYFYRPSNLTLIVAGNFDLESVRKLVDTKFTGVDKANSELKRVELSLNQPDKAKSISMDVAMPKLAVGFRGKSIPEQMTALEYKLALRLFFTLLFGWTSETYQDWYESGKIDQAFDLEFEVTERYQFVVATMDTWEPIAMSNRIKQTVQQFAKNSDFSVEHLERIKRDYYGEFLRGLDSIDSIVSQLIMNPLEGETYLDLPDYLDKIDLKKIKQVASHFIKQMDVANFTIFPK
ncbi:EF-P 5-aminopentanol modification-associated protein YfmH [Streptococcus loxodontisalivarius]|uniref:Zn-dependent peptidase n=1 Tax=Streptococcus loxodontisalivarius TaxID=1349415 RepID=A0ABS2PPD7_9STRE|nr:pitrilysin family protein [Streptococcus loxodontisalivarius]MBM7641896.1 putative Zn-dependent peptidase [Streptococcus loxodontisalivarius]